MSINNATPQDWNRLREEHPPMTDLQFLPELKVAYADNPAVSDGSSASYYELPKDATQLQDLISEKDMNAQIGEIFRSCYRYGEVSHSDKLRDAKKMKFYAEAEIQRLKNKT